MRGCEISSGRHRIPSRRYWEPSTDNVGWFSTKGRENPTPMTRDIPILYVYFVNTHRGRGIQSRRLWELSTDHVGWFSTKGRKDPTRTTHHVGRHSIKYQKDPTPMYREILFQISAPFWPTYPATIHPHNGVGLLRQRKRPTSLV